MLDLNSPKWSELAHAYGNASDIPALLIQLESAPPSSGQSEPWFSLWSSLAHQGDVYPASFAAVPHVIHALAANPLTADSAYFQFPAWVEICRKKNQITVPEEIAESYYSSLARIPELIAATSSRYWDESFMQSALSALATSKGDVGLAEALLELTPDVVDEFMEWIYNK